MDCKANRKKMKRIKVTFLSLLEANPYGNALIESLRSKGVDVENYSPKFFFLPSILKKNRCDIIHLHTIHFFFLGKTMVRRWIKFFIFTFQILILKLLGIKFVWTVHEWSSKDKNKQDDIYLLWAKVLVYLFDGVITHCNSTKKDICDATRIKSKEKFRVIPHANYIGLYESDLTQIKSRKALGVPDNDLIFLIFGNLIRAKGVLEAIDAFNMLPEGSTSLLIAGFPGEDDIEKLILEKVKYSQNIIFRPKKIPHEEVGAYMTASDCVLVPYKAFTTSGVTILAMSFGKACLAPRVGFFNEVLDDLGSFLYDFDNENGLLDAIVLASKDRQKVVKMGEHNFNLASQWSWDYVSQETLNLYRSCLNIPFDKGVQRTFR